MAIGAIFDVIIGMVFAYFLLALIASGVQEVIASIFSWRGSYLSKGIDVIIDSDSSATWQWSRKDFLIAHFTRGAPETAAQKLRSGGGANLTPAQRDALAKVYSVHSHPLVRSSPTTLPSYVSSRNFALALLETLRDGSKAPLFSQAERTISQLPDGDLRQLLSLFVQDAGGDLDKLRDHIEHWFDDAMDRLSGIYKRLSQIVMLFLGIVIAVGLNVDSARLAQTLWQDNAFRSAIVADASIWARGQDTPKPTDQACGKTPDKKTAQTQNAASTQNAGAQSAQNPFGPVHAAMKCFENENFPIGWNGMKAWEAAVPGWIITALAIGLGAPFWFSLLQQLTNLRNAGPAPHRSNGSGRTPSLTTS